MEKGAGSKKAELTESSCRQLPCTQHSAAFAFITLVELLDVQLTALAECETTWACAARRHQRQQAA